MQDMSEEERRAHILSMFKSANSWCMGTGTALPKIPVTSDDTRGPGKLFDPVQAMSCIFTTQSITKILLLYNMPAVTVLYKVCMYCLPHSYSGTCHVLHACLHAC